VIASGHSPVQFIREFGSNYDAIQHSSVTDRGFTDHEHLDDWQLIHMNGRGFDYNAGRFLSLDPFIQEPGNSQSINGFAYIMNNPLSGTDPSGYISVAPKISYRNKTTSGFFGGTPFRNIYVADSGRSNNGATNSLQAQQAGSVGGLDGNGNALEDIGSKGQGAQDEDVGGGGDNQAGTQDRSPPPSRVQTPHEDLSDDEKTFIRMLDAAIEDYFVKIVEANDETAIAEFSRTDWFFDRDEPMEEGGIALGGHALDGEFSFYWRSEKDRSSVVFGTHGVEIWVTNPITRGWLYHGSKFQPGPYGLRQMVAHEAGHTIRENQYHYVKEDNRWYPIRNRSGTEHRANDHGFKYFPNGPRE
jgi:RHS repeat-associated protein